MLSESSYLTAIYAYAGAACTALVYLAWWLKRHWRSSPVVLVVLVCAALLLTPAHPNADVTTFAPALIVALFESLTHGPEAAMHAVKPLAVALAVALALSMVFWAVLNLILFRRARGLDTGAGLTGHNSGQVE